VAGCLQLSLSSAAGVFKALAGVEKKDEFEEYACWAKGE